MGVLYCIVFPNFVHFRCELCMLTETLTLKKPVTLNVNLQDGLKSLKIAAHDLQCTGVLLKLYASA